MRRGISTVVGVISILGFFLVGIIGGYLISSGRYPFPVLPLTKIFQPKISATPLFEGELIRIPTDLNLFVVTDIDRANGMDKAASYYQAGIFTKGPYRWYKRILAVRPPEGPGYATIFTLATKDDKTYVLHDPDGLTTKYKEDDWRNPYKRLDKTKIKTTTSLDTEQPDTIPLGGKFILHRDAIITTSAETTAQDSFGQTVYESQIVTDLSGEYEKISSPIPYLNMWAKKFTPSEYISQMSPDERGNEQLRSQYFEGTTQVMVVDTTGLPVMYTLTDASHVQTYQKADAAYNKAMTQYNEKMQLYDQKKIDDPPQYPDIVQLPNLRFGKSEIRSTESAWFTTYDVAFPYTCGEGVDTVVVKNISQDELEEVGNVGDMKLYKLKNTSHPLLAFAYANKMSMNDEEFAEINQRKTKISKEEYIAQNPVLFTYDYWNRLITFGEYDYKLMGGCGKPVIYLYPPKPTTISVSLVSPVVFSRTLPAYDQGWNVKAYPDGTLVDVRPEKTDCNTLSVSHGLEYGASACQNNSYPYLYWSGNVPRTYPKDNRGWIVDAGELEQFLDEKLFFMGLLDKERADMLSYWVPELLATGAPYFKLSLFDTAVMNRFVPMDVRPVPDTVIRVFLDWEALDQRPDVVPEPQILSGQPRFGFTLVEWGGIRRHKQLK